jgi:hypothetical protein
MNIPVADIQARYPLRDIERWASVRARRRALHGSQPAAVALATALILSATGSTQAGDPTAATAASSDGPSKTP